MHLVSISHDLWALHFGWHLTWCRWSSLRSSWLNSRGLLCWWRYEGFLSWRSFVRRSTSWMLSHWSILRLCTLNFLRLYYSFSSFLFFLLDFFLFSRFWLYLRVGCKFGLRKSFWWTMVGFLNDLLWFNSLLNGLWRSNWFKIFYCQCSIHWFLRTYHLAICPDLLSSSFLIFNVMGNLLFFVDWINNMRSRYLSRILQCMH